jgi:hypothetical protein
MTAQTPIRPTAPAPTWTPATVDAVDQAIFSEDIRQFVKDKAAIVAAMKALYSVIWGQCSKTLGSKLKGDADYNTTSADADSLSLLKAVRAEMTGFKKRNYLSHSVHSIISKFYNIAQGKRSNQEFYDEFNNLVAAVGECGARLGKHQTIYREVISEIAQDDTNPKPEEKTKAHSSLSREQYLAVAFLLGANQNRYGLLLEEIENEYLRNREESSKVRSYPLTVADAYEYLENYKKNPRNIQRLMGNVDPGPSGMAFAQKGESGENQNERNSRSKRPPASTNNRAPTHEGNKETNSQHEAAFATHGEIVCRRCGEKTTSLPAVGSMCHMIERTDRQTYPNC